MPADGLPKPNGTTGRDYLHHYLHDDHQNLQLTDGRTLGPHGWIQQTA